jgi:D-glycero-alpha-D-manno-heptose 1-phosphate guanylyltransferase
LEAIILAGGRGTRLKELTEQTPKPLVLVKGRPFLDYVLEHLSKHGVKLAVLSVGYLAGQFQARYGTSSGSMKIEYAVEEEPKGTGGAIRFALNQLSDPNPMVLNGDSLFLADLKSLYEFHLNRKRPLTLALRPVDSAGRYGKVTVEGETIVGFEEKGVGGPGFINAGVYVLNKMEILHLLPSQDAFSFERDFLEPFVKKVRPAGLAFRDYFIDIGVPEDLEKANRDLPKI